MKELFPAKHVMGFVFSLILTGVALVVYFMDMSFTAGMTVLLITAFAQATLQVVLFMHAGESTDKGSIYVSVIYGIVIAIFTVLGTLLAMIWGYV
ncbi:MULTISPECIES: cytochrome aa3 quinol oxidase subunit IV [Clostridia]|uniref:cytochrome aa3 quinol oxidase subunit IV n=1 Tax=Clostridia TaxID=186801 RepID=UPI000EA21728|nr:MULTISPECIES: cytochrome aa3 quinol oxidase subunit IV [Clostridia]NBJ67928.1 cytochrome aa3 quinol oxidase subunit IV [Roseburia sp. 1XD42-34]RKI82376.1 cytochrome aa3 quinol oxidase subunit IV [Clostridium sp. 1xD42-85]